MFAPDNAGMATLAPENPIRIFEPTVGSANLIIGGTGFTCREPADVTVILQLPDQDDQILTLTTDYTLSGASPETTGYTVTLTHMPASLTEWPEDAAVVILRDTALTQVYDLNPTIAVKQTPLKQALDRVTRQGQEHRESIRRSVTAPYGEAGLVIPPLASRKDMLMGFSASGAIIAARSLAEFDLDVSNTAAHATAAAGSASAAAGSASAASDSADAAATFLAQSETVFGNVTSEGIAAVSNIINEYDAASAGIATAKNDALSTVNSARDDALVALQVSVDAAADSAGDALGYKNAAATSASAAGTYSNNAASSATAAATSRTGADSAKAAALTAQAAAESARDTAGLSASAADTRASAAAASQSAAATSATNAGNSATAAAGSAATATTKAAEAAASAASVNPGAANGVAQLGGNSVIKAKQLPKEVPNVPNRTVMLGNAWATVLVGAVSWTSIAWSAELGLLCAVATNGTTATQIMTSPDGVTWTTRTSPEASGWQRVVWSRALRKFVAIANSGTYRVMTSPDGVTWTGYSPAVAAGVDYRAMAWSAELGLFAAYSASGGGVIWSADGVTWTAGTGSAGHGSQFVMWVPELERFISVGTGASGVGAVAYSLDGKTWTLANAPNSNTWRGVTYSPMLGLLVAVASTGAGDRVMTSPDGITWTARTSAADNDWRAVRWAPELGLFLAVASTGTGNRLMYSFNGIDWAIGTSPADNNWFSLVWAAELGSFFAVAQSGTNRVMSSFSVGNLAATTTALGLKADKTYVDSVIANQKPKANCDMAATANITLSGVQNLDGVTGAVGKRVFVNFQSAPAQNGVYDMASGAWTRSTDCDTWTELVGAQVYISAGTVYGKTSYICNVAAGGTLGTTAVTFVPFGVSYQGAIDDLNTQITAKADTTAVNAALALKAASSDLLLKVDLTSVGAGSGVAPLSAKQTVNPKYLRKVKPNPIQRTFLLGQSWTGATPPANSWTDIAWSPEAGVFVAVSTTGTVATSPDGKAWTARTAAAANAWQRVIYSAERKIFVAVANSGAGNRVMYSSNGVTWTAADTTGLDYDWRGITWSPELGLFVVVGIQAGNSIMTSPNGVNWTLRGSAGGDAWQAVVWAAELELFVAVGAGTAGVGAVATSPDGIAWTSRTAPNSNLWRRIAFAGELGLLVAVASTGTGDRIITSPDGITWTARTNPVDNDWRGLCWSPDLGMFLASAVTGTGDRLMYSLTGTSWSSLASLVDNAWQSVVWAAALGAFVGIASSGTDRAMVSASGFSKFANGLQDFGSVTYSAASVPSSTGIGSVWIDTSNADGAGAQQYNQNYPNTISLTGGAVVQGVQILGKGTMNPATPNSGMAESNFLRTNHAIGSSAGKNFHWHTLNLLVSTANDCAGSDGPDGAVEGAIMIATWRATGPTTGTAVGGWVGDFHVEKYPGVADGKMIGLEVGMHKAPALGAARNCGIDVWSGPRSGATPATRAGIGIRIGGEGGWGKPLQILDVDNARELFAIDQNGNINSVTPSGSASQTYSTVANATSVTYQQVAKSAAGASVSGVMQTSEAAVLLGSTSSTPVVIETAGTGRWVAEVAGHWRPYANNAYSIGTSTYRASVIYAATGTINTSDAREKTVTGSLANIAIPLLEAIDPVLFTWNVGGADVEPDGFDRVKTGNWIEKQTAIEAPRTRWVVADGVAVQEAYTETIMVTEYGDPVPCVDAAGNPVMEWTQVLDDKGDPLFEEVPGYTDDGTPCLKKRAVKELRQLFKAVPIMIEEEIDVPRYREVTRAGVRQHAGVLAQNVKAALDAQGVDFGVWGLDDASNPNSRQWIRPDQLTYVLWEALKQTRAELVQLKAQVEGAQ